jgi:hypothetical protein
VFLHIRFAILGEPEQIRKLECISQSQFANRGVGVSLDD